MKNKPLLPRPKFTIEEMTAIVEGKSSIDMMEFLSLPSEVLNHIWSEATEYAKQETGRTPMGT